MVRRGAPVLESGLKSTRRLCRLYDGGIGQAQSACLCKWTEVHKRAEALLLLEVGFEVDVFGGVVLFCEDGDGFVNHVSVSTQVDVAVVVQGILAQPIGDASCKVPFVATTCAKLVVAVVVPGLNGFVGSGGSVKKGVIEVWVCFYKAVIGGDSGSCGYKQNGFLGKWVR